MRILLHDYAGHPFQVELSRALAGRGTRRSTFVFGVHSNAPGGQLIRRPDDAETFSIDGIELKRVISKYRFVQRFQLESKYGKLLVDECKRFDPDVVMSANTPSLVQVQLSRWCRARVAFVWFRGSRTVMGWRLIGSFPGNYPDSVMWSAGT